MKDKKRILILTLFIFLTSFVLSQTCDYKDKNYYTEETLVFYENGTQLNFQLIEITDFRQGHSNPYNSHLNVNAQFRVNNRHTTKSVNLTVLFNRNGVLDSEELFIDPMGYKTVTRTRFDNINQNTIRFEFHDEFSYEKKSVERYNETCRMCGTIPCLNDGSACTNSEQCGGENCVLGFCSKSIKCFNNDCKCPEGQVQCLDNTGCANKSRLNLGQRALCSPLECITGLVNKDGLCSLAIGSNCQTDQDCSTNICNIAKTCGNTRVVSCPQGTKNCNDSACLVPATKSANQPYSCDWECSEGTRSCEGICRRVSSKGYGKEYDCEWECKSDRWDGETKKCLMSSSTQKVLWILFGIFILFISSKFVLIPLGIKIKEFLKTKSEAEMAEEKLKDLERKIKNKNKEIEDIENDFNERKEDLDGKIQEKIMERKNASEEAKKRIDLELKKYENELIRARRDKELEISRENIEKEKAKKARENFLKEREEIERTDPERKIKRLKNKYINDYETGNRKIIFDEKEQRFFISSIYGNPEKLSRYVYKKIDSNIGNKEIHHINHDQMIDELWNLIALDEKEHNLISHDYMGKENWIGGIEELKRKIPGIESRFHEKIRNKLDSLKNNHKISDFQEDSLRKRKSFKGRRYKTYHRRHRR